MITIIVSVTKYCDDAYMLVYALHVYTMYSVSILTLIHLDRMNGRQEYSWLCVCEKPEFKDRLHIEGYRLTG